MLLLAPILISLPGSFNPIGTVNVAIICDTFFYCRSCTHARSQDGADHVWLQRWLSIVLMIWLGDGYIQFVFGHDILGVPLASDGRMMGPFPDNLHFGLFITVLMPMMLWRMASERPLFAIALIGLVGFAAAMSGARSNMLFYLLAIVTLIPRFGWWQRAAIVLALIIGVAAALGQSGITSAKFKQTSAGLDNGSHFERLDHILSGRLIIWETAGEMIKDRPLTGVGAGAFDDAYDHYATRPEDPFRSGGSYPGGVYHAHQMYVSITAESGLAGLWGLIAIIVLIVGWYYKASSDQRALAAPYAATLAVIAFPIQSQPILYRVWWFPIVLLLLCGLVTALQPRKT
jgi:O-antigen ligase